MERNQKLALALIIIFILLFIFGVFSLLTKKKPNLMIDVAPSAATITVDGKTVNLNSGGVYVKPGKHTVGATQDGFSSYSKTITKTDRIQNIAIALDPVNQTGYDYLSQNPSEQQHREAIIGKQATDTSKQTAKKNPVTSILPYIDQYFRIDYGPSRAHETDPTAIAVYITSYAPDGTDRALALLKSKGFDPSKLEIIYVSGQ